MLVKIAVFAESSPTWMQMGGFQPQLQLPDCQERADPILDP